MLDCIAHDDAISHLNEKFLVQVRNRKDKGLIPNRIQVLVHHFAFVLCLAIQFKFYIWVTCTCEHVGQ